MNDFISVCIPTFKRVDMLEHCIANVAAQVTGDLFDVAIIVVDNDVGGSARDTVMKIRNGVAIEIIYEIEPVRTIPAVRNHALRLSKGNYIGIIDDDEFPPNDWLLTMYRAIQTFRVDGALGPVHPFFRQKPPDWLTKGKFCERPVVRTGTILHWSQTRTGNVLLKREVFDKHNLKFDEQYTTGGSDQAFFREAMDRGCRFIAVAEAPVFEIVPPQRWEKSYYLKRALINGFNAHNYQKKNRNPVSHLITAVKSITALLSYAAIFPFLLLLGTHARMKYLEKGTHHLSRLCAMAGVELVKKR